MLKEKLAASHMRTVVVATLLFILSYQIVGCKKGVKTSSRSFYGTRLSKPEIAKPQRFDVPVLNDKEDYKDALQLYRAGALKDGKLYDDVRLSCLRWATKRLDRLLQKGRGKAGFEFYVEMLEFLFRHDEMKGIQPLIVSRDLDVASKKLLKKASAEVLKNFTSRGEVKKVLVAHGVLHYLSEDIEKHKKELRHVLGWLKKVEEAGDNQKHSPLMELLEVLENAAVQFPAPLVLEEMLRVAKEGIKTYAAIPEKEPDSGVQLSQSSGLEQIKAFQRSQTRKQEIRKISFYLAEARILAGQWKELLEDMESWPFPKEKDKLLIKLLKKVLSTQAGAGDFMALSDYFTDEAPKVAESICRAAAARFQKSAQPPYCLGKLAEKEDDSLREMINLERAVNRNMKWHEAWEHLAKAYLLRLHSLVARQKVAPVMQLLQRNIQLHDSAQMHWPTRSLEISPAKAYFAAGRAHTAIGKMETAIKLYKKALDIKKIPEVHGELGEVYYWKGSHVAAEKHFKAAVESADGEARQVFWLGQVAVKLSRSMTENGNEEDGKRLLMKAMSGLMRLVSAINDSSIRANLLVLQAGILDELGKRNHAVRLLRTAVDIAPDRSSTYSDALSFTVERGLLNEALDLYSRALVREEVTEYQKAYATFWILDLGRRCGVEEIRLRPAWDYLETLKGNKWYHKLASFYREELTEKELRKHAKNKGEEIEVDFYLSMRLLQKGKNEESKKLWKRIKRSMIYVFYEFRMVHHHLSHGMKCIKEEI